MRTLRGLVVLFVIAYAGIALAKAGGVAPSGQTGALHVVVKGDTLWDITGHYLGTPWIWPSIWQENEGVANPHLIYPGDLIWITENGMRKVSPEEAERLLKGMSPADIGPEEPDFPMDEPDLFAALDLQEAIEGPTIYVPGLQRSSFITEEDVEASSSVLGNHREHYWISQDQRMIVSAGEGSTDVGEEFTLFRVRRRVRHPLTGKHVGYMVEILGRAEITEVHPETSYAVVSTAYSEIQPGDRLLPFEELEEQFQARKFSTPVEGSVLAQQLHRLYSGRSDLVILDRGSEHGVDAGREFIIYRRGHDVLDPLTRVRVSEPDDLVARVFVLRSEANSSLALVTEAKTEIQEGDLFRSP
jgi:hypothetical protein